MARREASLADNSKLKAGAVQRHQYGGYMSGLPSLGGYFGYDPYGYDPYGYDPYGYGYSGYDPYGYGGYDPYSYSGYDPYSGYMLNPYVPNDPYMSSYHDPYSYSYTPQYNPGFGFGQQAQNYLPPELTRQYENPYTYYLPGIDPEHSYFTNLNPSFGLIQDTMAEVGNPADSTRPDSLLDGMVYDIGQQIDRQPTPDERRENPWTRRVETWQEREARERAETPLPEETEIGGAQQYGAFDPSGLQSQIDALVNAPGFDPSGLQSQINALSNAPGFDPSGLQSQIDALSNAPGFDPGGLQQQIAANQEAIQNHLLILVDYSNRYLQTNRRLKIRHRRMRLSTPVEFKVK